MDATQLTTEFIEECHEVYTLYSLSSVGLVSEIKKLEMLPKTPGNPNPTLAIGNTHPSEGRYQARVSMNDLILKGGRDGELSDSLSKLFIVHFYTLWNDKYRPSIAKCLNIKNNDLKCDFFGEIRIIRNAIVHGNSKLTDDDISKLKKLSSKLSPGYFKISTDLMADIMDEINNAKFYYPIPQNQ
ncbi:hypothetical protein UYSO10_2734 [Kosakonia radicincitans]|uniref:hypothetical protein n=1 Tax=Kosakonia radicincitans TaxID=283686 RepID=UPI001183567D|nr:hypothetical protein [Kosakonia radicincitans]VVT49259.1 hypothetical protein UYSO10_2734 [Kosakonia radicincitans]